MKHQHDIVVSTCCSGPGVESMLRAFKKLEKDPDIYVPSSAFDSGDGQLEKSQSDVEKNVCFHPGPFLFSQWSRFLLYTDHLTMTCWCLVGNGWDWGNGMIITSDYGSLPRSLLST